MTPTRKPECDKCFDEEGSYACIKRAHQTALKVARALEAADRLRHDFPASLAFLRMFAVGLSEQVDKVLTETMRGRCDYYFNPHTNPHHRKKTCKNWHAI